MLETDCFYSSEVTAQDRAMVPDDPVVNDSEKLSEFRQLSSEDVRRLVQRSAKARVKRRTSHEPNRMQMSKALCSPSLSFIS